ncbi:hypothetical protein [Solirubrobacter ginsenosidimutans]|uniref:hypothetical protein n=1 Tax=Solirubrobacter ginsenosidimutans TaxID=490573 RepID=UPI0022CE2D72|nr:hypothetical protein [Solirubrobacter ginsenosidimutans]
MSVALALTGPAAARADEPPYGYLVLGCSDGSRLLPMDGWSASGAGFEACAAGRGLGFQLSGPGHSGRWTLSVPTGVTIESVVFSGIKADGDPEAQLLYRDDVGAEGLPWRLLPDRFGYVRPGVNSFTYEFGCATPCSAAASLRVARVETWLRDVLPPTGVFDAENRAFRFEDSGGGVQSVRLEVDGTSGGELDVGGGSCHLPFVAIVPCAREGVIDLEAQGLSPGYHSVFATLNDAAGNRSHVGPFVVRTGPPPVAAPSSDPSASGDGVLTVDGANTRTVPYATVKVTGTARSADGSPAPGARVDVAARVGNGAWHPLVAANADAHGRFMAMLPKGPSREVLLSYAGAVATVRLLVIAPVQLAVDRRRVRNGQTVRFSGRIPDAGAAQARITLQAWARDEWVPFKSVALKRGRFAARYRFTGTPTTSLYRFRAVVDAAPDLPYAAGHSTTVSVLVQAKRGTR